MGGGYVRVSLRVGTRLGVGSLLAVIGGNGGGRVLQGLTDCAMKF